MQTFLPFSDFARSAKCLDMKRLGKQRVEAYQLLKGSWPNHPASKMWRGYEYALAEYGIAICLEWIGRGYKDTCLQKILDEQRRFTNTGMPVWFGRGDFHRSHRSNLLRKNPEHYSQYFSEPNDLEYVWPV